MFFYPPRPKGKLAPNLLKLYDNGMWFAQRKYNGTRNCIEITPQGEVKLWNRQGESHRQYQMPNSMEQQILSLNFERGTPYYLDSELMHAKTTEMKGKIVLFDILQAGDYLFGVTQAMRKKILFDICRQPSQLVNWKGVGFALKITDDLWLAETFYENFVDRFKESFGIDELEGLVLRQRNAPLDVVGSKPEDVVWQLRVRKPHKNYVF